MWGKMCNRSHEAKSFKFYPESALSGCGTKSLKSIQQKLFKPISFIELGEGNLLNGVIESALSSYSKNFLMQMS